MTDNDGKDVSGLLKHRDFLLFASSRASSVTASQMLTVAVGWMLYAKTGDPFTLALVGLFRFLPIFVLFLWAGAAADRYDRPRIIGICSLTQAISAGLIGLVLLVPDSVLWPVYLLLTVHGGAQAFLQPAQQSTLPDIVPKHLWAQAIAVTSTIIRVAQLGGPAIAGVLIAFAEHTVFVVIFVLSLITAASAAMIRKYLRPELSEPSNRLTHLLAGFEHIRRTPIVFGAITIDLVAVLFGGIAGLLPIFALDVLGVGAVGLGAMRAMPAIGGLGMGLLLGAMAPTNRTGPLFFIALGMFGLSIVVFSLSSVFWVSLVALFIYGAVDMFSVYVRQTLVQIATPDTLRGRVNAVNSVSISASNELGDFRAGSMAVLIGTVQAVALGGVVTLGAAALWWRIFPELRRVRLT
jgi:MFS family permease